MDVLFRIFTKNGLVKVKIPLCAAGGFPFLKTLKDTARYASLLLALLARRASAFGRGFFCPMGKKRAYYAVLDDFWHFWCPVLTLVTFKNPKK